ncbi:MAG: AAA family ATPase [Clostridiales bacterium]|nr:AAA family ATPase [Clostridiales bacterium]
MSRKQLTLTLDGAWVFQQWDQGFLPVRNLLDSMKKELSDSLDIKDSSFTGCIVQFDWEKTQDLTEWLDWQLKKCLKLETLDGIATVELIDASQQAPVNHNEAKQAVTEAPAEKSDAHPEKSPKQEDRSGCKTLQKIRALVGADDFKKTAEELVAVAPQIRKHGTQRSFAFQNYLFAINDGYGLSTCLELFAELIEELGLFGFKSGKRVEEHQLGAPGRGNGEEQLEKLIQSLSLGSGSRIICLDISEWIGHLNDKLFRRFLYGLNDVAANYIFVFRVPFLEQEVLKEVSRLLNDVLFTREIAFVPMDNSELTVCAKESLNKWGFTMDEDAWDVFRTRLSEEKSDGRFYGINTVNKIVNEMVYRKQLSNVMLGLDNTHIRRGEILSLAQTLDTNHISGMEQFDKLIGVEKVRERVEEIVAQIELALETPGLEKPCLHMRFVGSPGTGKTTVARILGQVLKERGILRNGNFYEYAGRDFCGMYVGHTAPKTAEICRDAYGSVLFIDEAYSLYDGDPSSRDFGREALDTLIAEMENHRSDLVVIMAGYPDEMERLMKGNIGLESRMPYLIEFPNYTREQLCEIFLSMIAEKFTYDADFEQAARDYFHSISDETMSAREFSNARLARNLFERTWGKAAVRRQMDRSQEFRLTAQDIRSAVSDKEFENLLKRKTKRLGFV